MDNPYVVNEILFRTLEIYCTQWFLNNFEKNELFYMYFAQTKVDVSYPLK